MNKAVKRLLAAFLVLFLSAGMFSCSATEKVFSAEGAPDYSQKDAWCRLPEITKDVDTFFIYPTEYMGFGEGDPDYATIDNAEMRQGANADYVIQASAYADSTNVFMPYYRQAALRYAGEVKAKTGDGDAALSGIPYNDITAALDYYFENFNNGRPFIIAGHSQGAAMTKLVLKKYFKEHPEYYERMIAAYVIGYAVTKDDLKANPHLKFATGETDTGVIISWNTEGPKNIETNAHNIVVLPGAISINPINWKLDDTYASASENLGSLIVNPETGEIKIGDVGADAQVVPVRGTVVTNAQIEPMPEELAKVASEFFGPDGRHESDYSFYYNNIKDNVAKRIAAYKASKTENAESAPDYSQKASWYQIPEIAKDVDTFYIYATEYIMTSFNEGASDYATLDNPEMLQGVAGEYIQHATTFADSTNVFMPYYRQAGLRYAEEVYKKTGNINSAISGMPYNDITAALDYYFKNYNNGRPFIIAGHSQGSAMTKLVLKKYFKEHPKYYERMIAAYVIGYAVTKDDLEANPHLKFATGETDTGVIISWNTEGRKNAESNVSTAVLLPGAISINPINWKLDNTYAPASENLGSLIVNPETGEIKIGDVGADAQVVPERGTVITNAKAESLPEDAAKVAFALFGSDGRHASDYSFYYNNIKANVAKRIAAYKASQKNEFLDKTKAKERMTALYGENKRITDGNYDKSLAVKCINGTFVGKNNNGVIAYKGIPFVGKQPVGNLRWKAPVDVVPDDGVYEAYYNAKSPYQVEDIWQISSLYVQGEDCLYLNVWKAEDTNAKKKPVMVWIHGGAFEVGGTSEPREEGSNFVKENPDVILVAIDYRLGVFGFLHLSHLPDGKDYPDAQNLGLLDQVMALKWVHENIAAFGGDPDNVTIMGQSAGGGSVSLLPLIKGSQKYFKRVIAQSGSPVFSRSTEESIACTNELMSKLGCKTVADLQKLDIKKFVDEADILTLRVWAERDGRILPLDPYAAYENGAAKDIDFMQGCTKDEMGYFIYGFGLELYNEFVADRMTKKLAQMTDKERALVESFCKDAKNVNPEYSATSRLFDQIVFIAPLFRMSENQTKAGGKSYTYFFMPESSWPLLRSGHAIELSTVFNHPEETLVTGRRFDETFSKTLRRMWVQFAKTGNPSLSVEISPDGKAHEWPLYDLNNKQIMILDEFNIHPEKESDRKILDWDRTYFLTKYYCI